MRWRAVAEGAVRAFGRFPEACLSAALATVAAIVLLDSESSLWWGLLRVGTLGVPLFLAVALFAERGLRGRQGPAPLLSGLVLRAAAAGLLVALYLAFARWAYLNVPQRYVHISITLHLLVAAAPCIQGGEAYGFWHFNRRLLFRLVLATIYGGAIFVGLVLALAALDNLFGVEVPDRSYLRLLFVVGLLFHPLFFLAGVPRDFASLNDDRFNPPGLRLFSQFVMVPLVALYVAILTAYLGKVLTTGIWPSGWIGYLVSGLATVGILSLLIVHPDRLAGERSWIDRYARSFWIAILPSAAMVLAALWQRVDQYGLTERRYFLGVLAIWLTAGAIVAALTGTRRIRWIPATLALLGIVTSIGPWSAYAVATRSQVQRLEEILTVHGALAEGRPVERPAAQPIELPFADWEQAEAVVSYMIGHHGTGPLYDLHAISPDPALDTLAMPEGLPAQVAGIMEALGIRSGPSDRPLQLRASGLRPSFAVDDFDRLAVPGSVGDPLLLEGDTLRFALADGGRAITMQRGAEVVARGSLAALIAMGMRLRGEGVPREVRGVDGQETETHDLPAAELVVELRGEEFAARLILATLTLVPATPIAASGDAPAETISAFSLDAVLLRRAPDR